MWKIGLKPSFHFACLETDSNFVSERRWHALGICQETRGSWCNNCSQDWFSYCYDRILVHAWGREVYYEGWLKKKKAGIPRINFKRKFPLILFIHLFSPFQDMQSPPGLVLTPFLISSPSATCPNCPRRSGFVALFPFTEHTSNSGLSSLQFPPCGIIFPLIFSLFTPSLP